MGAGILTPSSNDPQQRLWDRITALETRMAASERSRGITVTPFGFTTGSSASVPWYGGRAWIMYSGRCTVSDGVAGQRQLGMDLRINGVAGINLTGNWVLAYGVAGTPNAAAAFPLMVAEFTPAMIGGYGMSIGSPFVFSAAPTFSTQGYTVSGLVVEWTAA